MEDRKQMNDSTCDVSEKEDMQEQTSNAVSQEESNNQEERQGTESTGDNVTNANNDLEKKLEQLETERAALQEKIKELECEHRELEEFLIKMKKEFTLASEALKRDQEKKEKLLAESVARDLFPIIDTLDHALEHEDNSGLRMIRSQIMSVLEKYGVSEVGKEGETFDPNWHEFLGYSDGEENVVVRVVRKGYRIGDVLLRPALVIIGKGNGS